MPSPIRANLVTGGTISGCAREVTHLLNTKLLFFFALGKTGFRSPNQKYGR